ncbi:MAG: ABC transporter permease, partial [Chitinophagaceae bacterium]
MPEKYNQVTAMLAITKASLKAIFRSPSAVIFSFAFPFIFILVFGFLGNSGRLSLRVAFDQNADTANILYPVLKGVSSFNVIDKPAPELKEDLEKGRLTAIISIAKSDTAAGGYVVNLTSSDAVSPQNLQLLRSIINGVITGINEKLYEPARTYATINSNIQKIPGRIYRTIDFILPGQLGFSLLSSGVFGVAFIFFNLRQTLVLKRFFATPIRRGYIVFGEALSRVIFQLITAVVILLMGHYLFKFTLVHGLVTFLELLVLSFIGLIVFMGFGFVVSGVAKNESTIPPLANLFTLPQFLLAGTFFSIDNFPSWLQPICRALPLTHLNDAMRNVAFEGLHLTDCGKQ